MTEREALAAFWAAYPAAAKRRHLKVIPNGLIRGDDNCSPVTAVFWEENHQQAGCIWHVAIESGLGSVNGHAIHNAADNQPGHDHAIRARLLEPLQ